MVQYLYYAHGYHIGQMSGCALLVRVARVRARPVLRRYVNIGDGRAIDWCMYIVRTIDYRVSRTLSVRRCGYLATLPQACLRALRGGHSTTLQWGAATLTVTPC